MLRGRDNLNDYFAITAMILGLTPIVVHVQVSKRAESVLSEMCDRRELSTLRFFPPPLLEILKLI